MLNENIKELRKLKDLSQEELADRLHVVRQTVSKWEQGLSVPDADMLIALSETLETPVSVLLGETVTQPKTDEMQAISEKLEEINRLLAGMKEARRRRLHWIFIVLCAVIPAIAAALLFAGSPYLHWDYSDPEMAVIGTVLHVFEFTFVRIAPFALIGMIVGVILTRKKR